MINQAFASYTHKVMYLVSDFSEFYSSHVGVMPVYAMIFSPVPG